MHLTHLDSQGLSAYDLIIVGSSFAALPMLDAGAPGTRVLLLESGDVGEREDAAALTHGDEYGHFSDGYWPAHWIRAVGGTSLRWSGVVAALEPDDFAAGVGRPSWPIGRADLDAAYPRAAAWLGRPAVVCGPSTPFGDTLRAQPLSHDAPLRLPDLVLKRCAAVGIDLLTRHTVVRLTSARRDRVDGLVVTGPDRIARRHDVRTGQFVVLACGGLGNAQILLQPPEAGGVPVGNESGLVGRYLMEHPHVVSGDVLIRRDALPPLPVGFGAGLPAFRLAREVIERHDLLACSLAIQGPYPLPADAVDVHRHFADTWRASLETAALFARAEQEPSASNRVEILRDTTSAGSHRLRTHCSFSSRDLRSIEVTTRRLGEALAARQLGVVRLHNRRIYRETPGGGHTMGTTRMGTTRGDSVCDASLRVHGYANLYVSGSSVFPTSGAVNPTLTIVALALRLGAHLRRRLEETP